jgi:hypothetical protein
MKSSIFPLSDVPRDEVVAYLEGQGMPAPLIAWKYYDEAFNRGRNRAFVWRSKDRVKGFIGIIPCKLSTPAGVRDMVWTCDWSLADPQRSPGMGILLLKKVHAEYGFVGAVGGTPDTQAALPRMDTRTIPDAAAGMHLPLRLSALLEKAEARLPWLPKLSGTRAAAWPLPRPRPGAGVATEVRAGVDPMLAALFTTPRPAACSPLYDASYLEWQLCRRPSVRSMSVLAAPNGRPLAGALLWTEAGRPDHWRAAFRLLPGASAALNAVVAAAADRAAREGGTLLSTMLSGLDAEAIAVLRGSRFIAGRERQPLYITFEDGTAEEGFADLSYLDTDLAFL